MPLVVKPTPATDFCEIVTLLSPLFVKITP